MAFDLTAPTIGSSTTVPGGSAVAFSYNSVTFGPYVKTRVMEEPITSADNRTVKMSKITIQVSGYISQTDAGTNYRSGSVTILSGGTGYSVNDILTGFDGDTVPIRIQVNSVDGGGAILTGTVITQGQTTDPINPEVPTGGTGNGAEFTVTWNVFSVNSLDAVMLSIRRNLEVHGQTLRYVNKGYGVDLSIGPQGTQKDVAFGPKPGKFTWWPLGGGPDGCHGAGFEWEITTHIAECGQFQIAPGVFLEVAFSVNYDVGEDGIVVITYAGTATIPMSLNVAGLLDRNIDSEIGRIIRPVPAGFMRRHSRQLSNDRGTCTFNVVDRQFEVPYPDDCVVTDMRHRIKQDGIKPLWNCSISGTVRLSPTASRPLAWERFFNIVSQRMQFARQQVRAAGIGKDSNVILGSVDMEETLFQNQSQFTVSYRMIGAPLQNILRLSGLWRPIINAAPPMPLLDWDAQSSQASLANNAQIFKGYAGASFSNSNEVIINVCAGPLGSAGGGVGQVAGQFGSRPPSKTDLTADDATEPVALTQPTPDDNLSAQDRFQPESSWIWWECEVERVVEHNQVRHKRLAGTVKETQPTIDPLGSVDAVAADASDPAAGWTTTVNDFTQQVASPSLTVRVRGYGVRAAHRVNAPKMITYGGMPATLSKERTIEKTLAVSGGVIIYRTYWELIYIVAGPARQSLPANPMLNLDGSETTGGLQSGVIG